MLLTDVPAGLLDSHVLHIANVKKIATVKIQKLQELRNIMNPMVNKQQIIISEPTNMKFLYMSFWLVFMSWMANCYTITVSFNMDD